MIQSAESIQQLVEFNRRAQSPNNWYPVPEKIHFVAVEGPADQGIYVPAIVKELPPDTNQLPALFLGVEKHIAFAGLIPFFTHETPGLMAFTQRKALIRIGSATLTIGRSSSCDLHDKPTTPPNVSRQHVTASFNGRLVVVENGVGDKLSSFGLRAYAPYEPYGRLDGGPTLLPKKPHV